MRSDNVAAADGRDGGRLQQYRPISMLLLLLMMMMMLLLLLLLLLHTIHWPH